MGKREWIENDTLRFKEKQHQDKHRVLHKTIPSYISLLPNASSENTEMIKTIAEQKSIPLYRYEIDNMSNRYNSYIKIRVSLWEESAIESFVFSLMKYKLCSTLVDIWIWKIFL